MEAVVQKIRQAQETGAISAEAARNIQVWLTEKKYSAYANDIVQLIQAGKWSELNDSFFKVVPFGTGGRRGTVGIGPNRINKITIGESAQGLAHYVQNQTGNVQEAGVVIAHDTRLTSREFAEYVACIFAANGFTAYLFDSFRATPELSFAVRHLKAAAGVVISASHNPPPDNGFKAYWSDGGQIVPPHDEGIMQEVAQVDSILTVDFAEAINKQQIIPIGDEVDTAYIQAVIRESLLPTRSASLAYSPLHGTGSTNAQRVLEAAGFSDLVVVAEQATPDGHFPNIANNIPNPEVRATNDLVTQYAKQHGADIGITTDPDADRLGVVAKDEAGNYQFLTGNQIAALIGHFILEQLHFQKKLTPQHFIAKTIVTTDMLDAIAQAFGVTIYNNLLVGFKYIAELIRHKEESEIFVFGGEESHGILKGAYTRDKDAAVAALMIAELTGYLKDQGHTLVWQLNQLYRKYGMYWETLTSLAYQGAEGFTTMSTIMRNLREHPPTAIGDHTITSIIDRLVSSEGTKGDVLVFHLSADKHTRVTIRPSGTEPKLKIYTQVYQPIDSNSNDHELETAKQTVAEQAQTIESAIVNSLKV